MSLNSILFYLLIGSLVVTPTLDLFNIYSGQQGLDYYAESYTSKSSSYIHTISMPFTFYGISCWFPAIFMLNTNCKKNMQVIFWLICAGYYLSIDLLRGLLCILVYFYPALMAYSMTEINGRNTKSLWKENKFLFIHGMIISGLSLIFKELTIYLFDIPIRSEGIFNTIMYSTFYSTYHII